MTEREKIVEIILNAEITGIALKDVIGGETTAKKLADTLIENEIGDIAEWKAKANDWKQRFESRDKQYNEQTIAGVEALQLKNERIEKYMHKAKVLERALRNSLFDLLSIGCMVIDLGGEKDLTEKYNLDLIGNMPYRIKQAEKEIEEEQRNEQD